MAMHIDWTHATCRFFEPGKAFDNADPFFSVLSIQKIGPDSVLVSADLSQRSLKKSDIFDMYDGFRQAGFKLMYCWRKVGKRVPRGAKKGRIIRCLGELAFWEIEL